MRAAITTVARRLFNRPQNPSQFPKALYGKDDLPSVSEFVVAHGKYLQKGSDLKRMSTTDKKTTEIAKKVFDKSSSTDFFVRNIMSQPTQDPKETGSIEVVLSDISDFPDFRRIFETNFEKDVMTCVGGPSAEDQVVLASMISEIRDRLDDIVYMARDYKESNANHSAMQSHARHGTALNADRNLTGHALLPVIFMRSLLGITPEESLDPDYKKVDVRPTIDPTKLKIYFGNELNWLRQEYKKLTGHLTEHDINRLESMLSQDIMGIVEKKCDAEISGGVERAKIDSSSIHVALNRRDAEEARHENEELAKIGIAARELTTEEKEFFFNGNRVFGAWKYSADTHLRFDIHETNRRLAERDGVKWFDGTEVARIMLNKNKEGVAEIAGIVTKDGQYHYTNLLHFTGGYKVEYVFDKDSDARFRGIPAMRNLFNRVEDSFKLQGPLPTDITTSTGVSVNAIFRKSDKIKRIIEKYGHTGEIAVTNSHWTMIAQDDEHVVMRMTGGGNTGSEEYNPAYFLNLLANTRQIFGDDLVGILSTYGCPRAINARNSTEFVKFAEGGIISYGKGGTGNTKRHAEATIGLMMLGFDKEVVGYFNQFQNREGRPLGDEIEKIYQHATDVEFIHDNLQRVNRRMGYDKSISPEEMMATALMVVALSYALSKKRGKEKEGKGVTIEEVGEVDSTSPRPTSSTHLTDQSRKEETKESSR